MNEQAKILSDRIYEYLTSGGLLHPELANHKEVRELLLDLLDHIRAENER
jgi:hypothetical protein